MDIPVPTALTEREFRLLTWTRPGLSQQTISPHLLQKHCPLDNGRHDPHNNQPRSPPLGVLWHGFPVEITHSILKLLDLQSLTDFRAVSWDARALVSTVSPYQAIVQHAPDALRALLSTETAVYFTAQDIYDALCERKCFLCERFGPFLDLFTGHRCCLICTEKSMQILSTVKKDLRFSSCVTDTLRTLRSLPGKYSPYVMKEVKGRKILVRVDEAISAFRREFDLGPEKFPITDRNWQQVERNGPVCRYMSMIRIPVLDRQAGTLDWYVSCQACRLATRDGEKYGYSPSTYGDYTMYSASEYMKHFQKCQMSQRARIIIADYLKSAKDSQEAMLDVKCENLIKEFWAAMRKKEFSKTGGI
jgi:hypothetical protein